MSVAMEIDWDKAIVEFRVSGLMTAMAIVDGFALLRASPQGLKLRGIVWDLRGADFSQFDPEALGPALRASPFPETAIRNIRIAAVADLRAAAEIGERWIAVGKTLDIADRCVFECIDDAREWVRTVAGNDEPTGQQASIS